MRMVMRLAYATVNPVTVMQKGSAITARWPFGAVLGVGTTPPVTGAIDVKTGYPATGGQLAAGDVGTADVEMLSGWEQGALEAKDEALGDDTREEYNEKRGEAVERSVPGNQQQRGAERSTGRRGTGHAPRSTDKTEE
jgi:hypothetical protein